MTTKSKRREQKYRHLTTAAAFVAVTVTLFLAPTAAWSGEWCDREFRQCRVDCEVQFNQCNDQIWDCSAILEQCSERCYIQWFTCVE